MYRGLNVNVETLHFCVPPQCGVHTHRLTNASQSQAWIQKRAAANKFKHRYAVYLGLRTVEFSTVSFRPEVLT